MTKRSRVLTALAVCASLIVMSVPSASGTNNYGATGGASCSAGNVQDNNSMTYYRDSLRIRLKNAVQWVLDNRVDPTDMNVANESSQASSTTDVVFMDGNYTTYCGYVWANAGDVVGLAQCVAIVSSTNRCERFDVRFDTSFTNGATTAQSRLIACHEIGHTLGLKHRENGLPGALPQYGCMPAVLDISSPEYTYTGHDDIHIDANF